MSENEAKTDRSNTEMENTDTLLRAPDPGTPEISSLSFFLNYITLCVPPFCLRLVADFLFLAVRIILSNR